MQIDNIINLLYATMGHRNDFVGKSTEAYLSTTYIMISSILERFPHPCSLETHILAFILSMTSVYVPALSTLKLPSMGWIWKLSKVAIVKRKLSNLDFPQ